MTHQTTTIAGRNATVASVRVRHANKAWGYYNRIIIRSLDNNETLSMGAAEFSRWSAKLEREHQRGRA